MSVGIYLSADSADLCSQNGLYTKPFSASFNGKTGGIKEFKLYLRNDSLVYYYTDIVLSLDDLNVPTIVDNPLTSWKLSLGDTRPTSTEWSYISPNNTLTSPDIGESGAGDISTFLPFWVEIKVPAGRDVSVNTNIRFKITGEEALV